MNTLEQALTISQLIHQLIGPNKGVFRITLHNVREEFEVRVLNFSTRFDANGFTGTLTTFTSNINDTTAYDIYQIRTVR